MARPQLPFRTPASDVTLSFARVCLTSQGHAKKCLSFDFFLISLLHIQIFNVTDSTCQQVT
jgi:hypothetical protein